MAILVESAATRCCAFQCDARDLSDVKRTESGRIYGGLWCHPPIRTGASYDKIMPLFQLQGSARRRGTPNRDKVVDGDLGHGHLARKHLHEGPMA